MTVHSTRYGGCSCGRGWLAVDGKEIADFNTLLAWSHYRRPGLLARATEDIQAGQRSPGALVEPGEFTRFELHEACWEFIHSNPQESLKDERPLVRALAVLHAKAGRNRLKALAESENHPLVLALIDLRLAPTPNETGVEVSAP